METEVVNSQKLTEMAGTAKQAEGSTGFMDPGQKVKPKNKGGRPTKEEQARRAAEQKAKALGKDAGPTASGPGPSAQVPPEVAMISQIPSSELAKPIVGLISSMGVQYVGDPRAAMKPDEFEAAARALGLLVDKYMPNVMSKYGVEAVCLLTFGQYGLRLVAMKKVLAHDKANAENLGPAQAPGVKNETTEEKIPEIFPQGEAKVQTFN